MSDWQFDRETAVAPAAEGRWTTAVDPAWNIGENPNGGYLASPVLRALGDLAGLPRPASITTHYLRPGSAGAEGEVRAETVRAGRRVATVTGALHQGGKERLRMIAGFTETPSEDDDTRPTLVIPPVDIPSPDACAGRDTLKQGIDLPILSRLDIRIDPRCATPGAAAEAEMAGWVRFADGRPPDVTSLLLFADAFPPSVYARFGSVGWVPTLELTVHVRRAPAPGWIMGRFRTTDMTGGMLIEDGELWDETGALVARSRQLAMLLTG